MFVITFNYPLFNSFLHACGSARDKDGAVSALHRNVETRSFSLSIYKHIDIEFISLNAQMAFSQFIVRLDISRSVVVHGFLACESSLAFLLPVGVGRHAGCFSEYLVECLGGLVAT